MLEGPAEELQGVADAEDVVARGPVEGRRFELVAGRVLEAAVRDVAVGDQPGGGILQRVEAASEVVGVETRGHVAGEQMGQLDRVAPGADRRSERARGGGAGGRRNVHPRSSGRGGRRPDPAARGRTRRAWSPGRARRWPAASLVAPVAQLPGGIAGDDRPVRDILRDDRAGRDHDVAADGHAVEDRRVGADPHVVADRDALAEDPLRETPARSLAMWWLKPRIDVCAPMRTPSPIRISPRITAKGFTEQSAPNVRSPVR